MYAVITSIGNSGGLIGSMLGAFIINQLDITATSNYFYSLDFDNLWIICFISNVFIFVPILLLFFVNFNNAISVTKTAHQNESIEEVS
jgi:hypothetical protein